MTKETAALKFLKMFNETEPISKQLPIELEGGFIIAELLVKCAQCGEPIEQELMHGYATQPLPNTAAFHAVCICKHCKHICESVNRLKEIGERTIRIEKLTDTGLWVNDEHRLKRKNWLLMLIKRIFK